MKNPKTIKCAKNKMHLLVLIFLSGLFFFGIGHAGYFLEPDSYNYIECNFGREPLYPMVLLFFRTLFGEPLYYYVVWIFQSILAAVSVIYCTWWFKRRFRLNTGAMYAVFFLMLLPYWFITIWYEPAGLWTNYILTEGLTFSLYNLFLVAALKTAYHKKTKDYLTVWLWSVLLSALRSQMLVCFVVNIALFIWILIAERKAKRLKYISIQGLLVILTALGLYSGVKTVYKYRITDSTDQAETAKLALLSNLLYSSDTEDVSCYEGEMFQTLFMDMYARMDEQQLNYKYAEGLIDNGDLMYESHDLIKYGVINDVYYSYVRKEGFYENRTDNMNLEEVITGLEEPLLRNNWWKLLKNSICGWPKGYMRSIFTASDSIFPLNVVFCAFMYISSLFLCIKGLRMHRWKEVLPMLIILGFTVMTVSGVALTIYVSMRYMIYNLGLFYVAYMILLLQFDHIAGVLVQKSERD